MGPSLLSGDKTAEYGWKHVSSPTTKKFKVKSVIIIPLLSQKAVFMTLSADGVTLRHLTFSLTLVWACHFSVGASTAPA